MCAPRTLYPTSVHQTIRRVRYPSGPAGLQADAQPAQVCVYVGGGAGVAAGRGGRHAVPALHQRHKAHDHTQGPQGEALHPLTELQPAIHRDSTRGAGAGPMCVSRSWRGGGGAGGVAWWREVLHGRRAGSWWGVPQTCGSGGEQSARTRISVVPEDGTASTGSMLTTRCDSALPSTTSPAARAGRVGGDGAGHAGVRDAGVRHASCELRTPRPPARARPRVLMVLGGPWAMGHADADADAVSRCDHALPDTPTCSAVCVTRGV